MARKNDPGLIIPAQYFKQIAKLPCEEAGVILQSIISYMQNPDTPEPELSARGAVVYEMLCDDVAVNVHTYRLKQEQGRAAAEKQWEERRKEQERLAELERMVSRGQISNDVSMGTHDNPRVPMDTHGSARESMQINNTVLNGTELNGTVLESVGAADAATPAPADSQSTSSSQPSSKPKPQIKRFVPPTVEQVRAYATEQGLSGLLNEADRFFDYYEANGWMAGKNKMKSWQAAARNWDRRSAQYGGGGTRGADTDPNRQSGAGAGADSTQYAVRYPNAEIRALFEDGDDDAGGPGG